MKDYQDSYSEKFKDALRKFNASETAMYFIVQTSTTHDNGVPFTTVTVYNKKKNIYWEAPLISEFCSGTNTNLTTLPQTLVISDKSDELTSITVVKSIIGFGIATSLSQVNEIITYMEADNRDLSKIYLYDYDLVIQELVPPAKVSESVAVKPHFIQPIINPDWDTTSNYTQKSDTDNNDKKGKGKKQPQPKPGVIPGFNN